MDVDYISSRHALVENRKSSPYELGLGWAVKLNDQNNFIGKKALMKEYSSQAKWKFVGIEIEWDSFEKHFRTIGLPPALPSTAWRNSTPIYFGNKQVGYATSGCWSPILKRYIALAHLESEYAEIGTKLNFEIKVEHYRKLTTARVVQTPFFNPERKRSCLL